MPKTYDVEIVLTKDYLHSCLKPEMLYPGAPKPRATCESIANGWRNIVRWNEVTKELFTPGASIERACRDAAALTKMTTQRMSVKQLALSGLFVEDDSVVFLDPKGRPIKGDLDSLEKSPNTHVLEACYRNPRSGAGVSTRLAVRAGCRLRFNLNVLHDELNEAIIETILDRAGRFIGIGSWRPRYGRFKIVSIKEIGQAKKAA